MATERGETMGDNSKSPKERVIEELTILRSFLAGAPKHANDLKSWTFDEGVRAQGPNLSVGVPDGYTAAYDCGGRPFIIARSDELSEDDRDEPCESDRILYSALSPTDGISKIAEEAIPEIVRIVRRKGLYGNINSVDEEWLLRGENCECVVGRIRQGPDTFEYFVHPVCCERLDSLRLTFYNQDDSMVDLADRNVAELVSTVRLNEDPRFPLLERLNKCAAEKVEFSEALDCVQQVLGSVLVALKMTAEADAERACQLDSDISRKTIDGVMAGSVCRSYKWVSSYAQKTMDVYCAQRSRLDADGRNQLYHLCRQLLEMVIDGVSEDIRNRPEFVLPQAFLDAKGRCEELKPEGYEAYCEELERRENRPRHNLIERDAEPDYVGCNGFIDAMAVMWLLYTNKVFFRPRDITWDGTHHAVKSAQLNRSEVGNMPAFIENAENYCYGVADLLQSVEKDEGLIVPIDFVHPLLKSAFYDQDVTGITLANLAAVGSSLRIEYVGEVDDMDAYRVLVDTRLLAGVPCMNALTARLIWDMRAYNEIEGPFRVAFAGLRTFDDNDMLGDFHEILETPVPGAKGGADLLEVEEVPCVELPVSAVGENAGTPGEDDDQDDPWDNLFDDDTQGACGAIGQEDIDALIAGLENGLVFKVVGLRAKGRGEHLWDLAEGSHVILASDWRGVHNIGVDIEVFDDNGNTLGVLGTCVSDSSGLSWNEVSLQVLACLLPFVDAWVHEIKLVTKDGEMLSSPTLVVELALPDGHPSRDELVTSVRRILSSRRRDRPALVSIGRLACKELHGIIVNAGRRGAQSRFEGDWETSDNRTCAEAYRRAYENWKRAEAKTIDTFLIMLARRFANAAFKPDTMEELESLLPDYANDFARFKMLCKQLYDTTPNRKLKNRGILSRNCKVQKAELSSSGTPCKFEKPTSPDGTDQAVSESKEAACCAEIERICSQRDELVREIAELEGQISKSENLENLLSSLYKELSRCGPLESPPKRKLKEMFDQTWKEIRSLENVRARQNDLFAKLHDVNQRLRDLSQGE